MLEEILTSGNGGYCGRTLCDNQRKAEFKEYRHKKLQTVLWIIFVNISYYNK